MTEHYDDRDTEEFADHDTIDNVNVAEDSAENQAGNPAGNAAENADHSPTVGELDLEARSSLRRLTRGVNTYTDEQSDGYDVEYRKLRLEKVVLVGVWTEGTVAQIEARLAELKALAETAGSEIVDTLYPVSYTHLTLPTKA